MLIADRNNNRVLLVSPSKHVVWQDASLRGPDDAFFTPGYRSVITNEEFNDTLVELSLKTHARVWQYGHGGVAGSSPGYLNTPDDAYRLPTGDHDRRRHPELPDRAGRPIGPGRRRVLGGSCVHDPPRGFASPNGDTPLPDGGLLVTEIGGWIDRLDAPTAASSGRSARRCRTPRTRSCFRTAACSWLRSTTPAEIVIVDRSGHVVLVVRRGERAGPAAKPSLAVRWPNGLIAANDDYNHRVIVIDPKTKRIVWQYGHTGVSRLGPGYLSKPDGLDLLPATDLVARPRRRCRPDGSCRRCASTRVGSLPRRSRSRRQSRCPSGRVLVLGGLVGGSSSTQVLLGTPARLRREGSLPVPTHDAAAALVGGRVYLFGGGEAVSTDSVVRVDPGWRTATARAASASRSPISAPPSSAAARTSSAATRARGSRRRSCASGPGRSRSWSTRLPVGLRYAGVAALGSNDLRRRRARDFGRERCRASRSTRRPRAVRQVATLPPAGRPRALAPLGSRLLLGGGGSRQVLAIDPARGRVTPVAKLPQALADPAAVAQAGRVLVLGGGTNAVYALG